MWVSAALQQREPGAQPRIKGDPRTGLLGARTDFALSTTLLPAERPEGEAGRDKNHINFNRSINIIVYS
jgi:hypothetical protein